MKKIINYTVLALAFLLMSLSAYAQEGKEVIKQLRDLPAFNNIVVGGAFEIFLTQGEPQSVEVETNARFMENVSTEVDGNTLYISSKGIKNISELNIYLTIPVVEAIEISGAAELHGENAIKADKLDILSSGASEVRLTLEANQLVTSLSGASEVKLTGKAATHTGEVSGAASLYARDLETEKTTMTVSGAGSAYVWATEEIAGDVSGAGDLDYSGNPENKLMRANEATVYSGDEDSVRVRVAGIDIEVKEGPDTVRIKAGNRVLIIDDNGEVRYERSKRHKFNGHWAGFDIGLNGYVNGDYNMNFPKEYEYLDLRMEKSIAIGINFFEQNIRLSKNQKWGMLTGLGLGFNDYRFLKPTQLSMDSSTLEGYLYDGVSIRKSKLSVMYLTLPLIFEFQTNPWCKKNSFHFGAGMVMGTRLMSHTKVYFNEYNKDYTLNQYDPETGKYQAVYMATSPNTAKVKHYGDWYLNPFKFDATVRVGWGVLNLFATFSVNSLFREGKGPELYPWSAGISLVNF
jgi:hypothetical protein